MDNIKEVLEKIWICPKCGKEHSFNPRDDMEYLNIEYNAFSNRIFARCIRCKYNTLFYPLDITNR